MSSFRRYGGLNFSGNNNITKSYISNSEQMNITNYSGQPNSNEVFASNIDMSGNSILHTGTIYFQDGTSMSSATSTLLGSNNVWTGTNTFNSLPTSSQTVTSSNQLVTKSYVDSKTYQTYQVLNFSPTEVTNIKKSIIYRNVSTTITSNSITAKLDNAPTIPQVYTFGKQIDKLVGCGGVWK